MTDIIERLYSMQGMGDVQLKALMDGVGPKGAEEIKRLRAELAETRANYEQYGTAMRQNIEDRDAEIERLRAELDAMKTTWLSPDSYDTLMQERKETLQEIAGLRAELDALLAWKEEAERQEPVGVLHVGSWYGEELQDWEFEADQTACDRLNEAHQHKEASLSLYARPVPAQSVPAEVMRDAARDRWLRKPTSSVPISGRAARDSDVYDEEIDRAMANAQTEAKP